MDIDTLTIDEAKELAGMFCGNDNARREPWVIGKSYFIRTVTMHLIGTLKSVSAQELVLSDAAWVADSGRFNEFIDDPRKAREAEPFHGDAIVGRGAIVDATVVSHIITKVIG